MSKKRRSVQDPQILKLDDDFTLVKRFIDGEESAFNQLVVRHKERVRSIIYTTVNHTDYIDDIAQDVFVKVYRNLNRFRFESQFSTWVYRITINKCKDHLRKIKVRKMFTPLMDSFDKADQFKNETEESNTSELVRNAISKLPEKLKMPLLLKDIEGFSYQEIAESVQCEIGTVKSRIFRAREKLKEFLMPYKTEIFK
ncbi:MAG: sigma-70 family RNA polymerase sigma factor [Bacteroidetes bacterium]|nr:sigma-70 family RNA polymerase sigma factor [Bacteroidota bacterium]